MSESYHRCVFDASEHFAIMSNYLQTVYAESFERTAPLLPAAAVVAAPSVTAEVVERADAREGDDDPCLQ